MTVGFATLWVLPLLCTALCVEPATPATRIRTFHVTGTIRDSTGVPIHEVKVNVEFRNAKLSETVWTNKEGVYEADLPLGIYTMTVEALQFRLYRRPEFRVMKPITVTINATLAHLRRAQNATVFNREYGVTREGREGASNVTYYDGDFFSVPSDDGTRFRLYISYVQRTRTDYSYEYIGDDAPPYDDPVFAAYNLFSLRANTVHYDMESRRLEARGNVMVEDEAGKRTAAAMTFKIENGRAVPIP